MTIGFSPCPNDTFIFDAMIHGKVDTCGLQFEPVIADVEELNRLAKLGELDITKLSYHAYAYVAHKYNLLNAGSALGNNCGPLLIAKKSLTQQEIEKGPIAIPGQLTTANFLLSVAYPQARNKKEMVFSAIENAVLQEEVIAGLIIHENRFTYAEKGLVKLVDLGEYWENAMQLPIPLGGIAIRKSIPADIQQKVDKILRNSVLYAFNYSENVMPFVRKHAQEMDDFVMQQHIQLYVNNYTVDLGEKGKKAVESLFEKAVQLGLLDAIHFHYVHTS